MPNLDNPQEADNPSHAKANGNEQNLIDVKPPEGANNPNPPDGPNKNEVPEKVVENIPEPEPRGKPTDPWFEALNPELPLLIFG